MWEAVDAAGTADVAEDVSDWIATPATLNDKSQERRQFSSNNSIVQRRQPENERDGCVCYTVHSLPPGQVWQNTILETSTTRKWSEGLAVGVTATPPDQLPSELRWERSGAQEWNYVGSSLYHNGRELSSGLPNLPNLKPHQKVGLFVTASGDLHVFIDGRHEKKVASGLPVKSHLWGAMDVYGKCTKIKSELLSDPLTHLQEALKDGYIPHKDDLFLIHGPGGVGKSSLISMFLGKQRDLARVSTAVAEESLHLCPVRDVSTSMFTDHWELVDIDRQARMVAHTSRHLLTNVDVKRIELQTTSEVLEMHEGREEATECTPFLAQLDRTACKNDESYVSPRTLSPLANPKKHKSKFSRKIRSISLKVKAKLWHKKRKQPLEAATSLPDTLVTSLGDGAEDIEGLLDRIQQDLHKYMRESLDRTELFLYYSIRVVDSGGQPQFHEVVSIILRAVTGIVTVFKLSEPLDVHGDVVFYKNGVHTNDPYKSYLTNEQVIRHDLLAIQSASHSGTKELPSLAFVGTFLDQQDACPEETPDQKDERLHAMITDILPEELQECVISNGKLLTQLTFRVNTRMPNESDYQTTGRLKEALMGLSQVKPKNLPLKWCTYEVALHKLMEGLKRQVLSLQDCEFLGYKLGFSSTSLKACLYYLRKFHIISFYDVLPNIIFGSCQVILDKITELVIYSLELKKGNRALNGTERKFYQQGILSQKILESKACSKHYRPRLFTKYDLLAILKSLLIITEVWPGEYLMPCVLEISDIFPSPPLAKDYTHSSFVIHFSKKSPILGIYCCTISYLLTKAGWNLLSKGGEVVQVARNSMTFKLPRNLPGKLTFLDPLSSYLEVVVELPAVIATNYCKVLYPQIRDTFIAAIKEAMKTLHYEVRTPELAFLCPESKSVSPPRCSAHPHLATVDKSLQLLTCSTNPESVFHSLSLDQKTWILREAVDVQGAATTTVQSTETFAAADVKMCVSAQCQEEGLEISGYESRGASHKRATVAPPLSITSKQPTMPQLLEMDLPSRVGPKINIFGTYILQDDHGNEIANIRRGHQGRPEEMAMEVLRKWLAGTGVEVSWESLIITLRKSKLQLMANQIQIALDQLQA